VANDAGHARLRTLNYYASGALLGRYTFLRSCEGRGYVQHAQNT
jgi:hypothetical protein